MKTFLLRTLLALLIAPGISGLAYAEAATTPPVPLAAVVLESVNGWSVTVSADGSARLQFGSGPLDRATAPAGTVGFTQLRQSMEAQSLSNPDEAAKVSGAVREIGQRSITLRPLHGTALWNALMRQLTGKLQSLPQDRFDALVHKKPLVLPE